MDEIRSGCGNKKESGGNMVRRRGEVNVDVKEQESVEVLEVGGKREKTSALMCKSSCWTCVHSRPEDKVF